jgi:hypothetical protein
LALLQATRTVPIVFVVVSDPVGAGHVDSLARPGGNATGFMNFGIQHRGKWLELLKQMSRDVTRRKKQRLAWPRYNRLSPLAMCCANLARIHFTYMHTAAPGASRGYPHGGMAYANPDAVTQIANGLSTTTFTFDNNGNVTQKTVDGTNTTYVYDYANRLTALGVLGSKPATPTSAYRKS